MNRVLVSSLLITVGTVALAGCDAATDRSLTPADQPTVRGAMSALTAPPGYTREATCTGEQAACFNSGELISAPVAANVRTLLTRFGLVTAAKQVECLTTGSGASTASECNAFGRVGRVELGVTVASAIPAGHSALPRGTRIGFTPARIKR